MTDAASPPPRPVVLVTGLSGAGKASILRVLEDLCFETVDNPPLHTLEELASDGGGLGRPLAAGVDTRTRGFSPEAVLLALRALGRRSGVAASLVYATADDATLLGRYTETRRRHPMAPSGGRVADGIARERALMEPLRAAADWVVDTSGLPSPALRQLVERRFRPEGGGAGLSVLVQSFAFPRGLPRDADLVFDLRFLRNPHYDPALRPLTGRDAAVAAHVEADPDFRAFWDRLVGFLDPLLPRYVAEGKKYLTVALGCTGGRHRSVLVAERLAAHLRRSGWQADAIHRELSPGTGDGAPSGHRVGLRDAPASEGPPAAEQEGREALFRTP